MTMSWLACCVARGGDEDPMSADKLLDESAVANADFFDCYESALELEEARRNAEPGHLSCRPALELPAAAVAAGGAPSGGPRNEQVTPMGGRAGCCDVDDLALSAANAAAALGADCCEELANELSVAAKVLERTRERWSRRVLDLRKEALQEFKNMREELPSWADLRQAQRMLKANIGDVAKAVDVFLQAIELRAMNTDMYDNLVCDTVCCDMRIIGRDVLDHPVVYMCAGSQNGPLRHLISQFVVTFEAACKLAAASVDKSEGRVYFVFDMTGMRPHLFMDWAVMRELAKTLGTVFAERIFRIVVVDFSRAAQAIAWTVKQLMTEVTRNKFAFVGEAKALEMCSRDFDGAAIDNLRSSLKINRDASSTTVDREMHARRTAIHTVPLGPMPVE